MQHTKTYLSILKHTKTYLSMFCGPLAIIRAEIFKDFNKMSFSTRYFPFGFQALKRIWIQKLKKCSTDQQTRIGRRIIEHTARIATGIESASRWGRVWIRIKWGHWRGRYVSLVGLILIAVWVVKRLAKCPVALERVGHIESVGRVGPIGFVEREGLCGELVTIEHELIARRLELERVLGLPFRLDLSTQMQLDAFVYFYLTHSRRHFQAIYWRRAHAFRVAIRVGVWAVGRES